MDRSTILAFQMPIHTTIYLIRHAQSRPTAGLAEPLWPLSPIGEEQADRLAALLDPLEIDAIVSSPYVRCLDTVRPFAGRRGFEVALEDGLRERTITTELRRDFDDVLRRSWDDFHFALPGCESSHEAQHRIRPAVEQILSGYPDRTVAVCSHGNAISLLLNSLEPAFGLDAMLRLRNPDVLRLRASGGHVEWDEAFSLEGLGEVATAHHETAIEW